MVGNVGKSWLRAKMPLSVGLGLAATLLEGQIGFAQVQSDGSLGTLVNNSLTEACLGVCTVTGGANPQNGPNLFQSFRQFSLAGGDTTQFVVEPTTQNLLVRVTGLGADFVSNINGTIQAVDGGLMQSQPVNLFFINPNGIVFGPASKLEMGGSVLATTAERMQFADGAVFSAGQVAQGAPLLTVSSPMGLQMGAQAGDVRLEAVDWLGGDRNLVGFTYKNLALVGGKVDIENGQIWGLGGEVAIAAIAPFGNVNLDLDGRLSLPDSAQRSNVAIQNSRIILLGDGERDLEVTAQRIDLNGVTFITGRFSGIAVPENPLDAIRLDASEAIVLVANSVVSDTTLEGNAPSGGIRVITGFLDLQGGSQILTSNVSSGQPGEIRITATEGVRLQGLRADGLTSSSIRSLFSGAGGKSSNIVIGTSKLEVLEGAQFFTQTTGAGDAGDIQITASDSIVLQGQGRANLPTSIGSQVGRDAEGNGGNLSFNTASLEVLDGAQIGSLLFGKGQAGDVEITADRILVQGEALDGTSASSISTAIQPSGQGTGSDVRIRTAVLELLDGGQISASTIGIGNAGAVNIRASNSVRLQGELLDGSSNSGIGSDVQVGAQGAGGEVLIETPLLEVLDGATISASTFGVGNAGQLRIRTGASAGFDQAGRVRVQGRNRANDNSSLISSSVQEAGRGTGGEVEIDTGVLEVLEGGQISAFTQGIGDAGNLKIRASDRILLQGSRDLATQQTTISANVSSEAQGNGGSLQIDTSILEVLDGGQIGAITFGQGNAGNIEITARKSARFDGISFDGFPSGAFSSVEEAATGQGGDLVVETPVLEVLTGAALGVSTFGQGDAGTMRLNVSERILIAGSDRLGLPSIAGGSNSRLSTGKAGSLQITTPQLTVTDGGVVETSTSNSQPGGEIILALGRLDLLNGGQIANNSDGGSGPAGSIQITATEGITIAGTDPTFANRAQLDSRISLFYLPESTIAVRSTGTGAAGDLALNTPILILGDRGQLIADSNTTTGGNLNLNLDQALMMEKDSLISATAGRAQGSGNGGNITINAPFVLSFPNNNSDILANAFSGTGGNITIDSEAILNFQLQSEPNIEALRRNLTNDISASSQLGNSGLLNLAGLNVDPSQGTSQIRLSPPLTSTVDRTCSNQTIANNRFVLTGRSGLPLSPDDPPSPLSTQVGWVPLPGSFSVTPVSSVLPVLTSGSHPDRTSPVEADRWQQNAMGEVVLMDQETKPLPTSQVSCGLLTKIDQDLDSR